MTNERRLKIFYLSRKALLGFLNFAANLQDLPDYLTLPIGFKGLPDGAEVHHVFPDVIRDTLGVVVAHESFDEVPDGEELPVGTGAFSTNLPRQVVRVLPLADSEEDVKEKP